MKKHETLHDAFIMTPEYQRSRCERKKVEMLFAHLKRILKLDKLRLRGPSGARDEFLLAATAQNLRRMACANSTGSRPDTCIKADKDAILIGKTINCGIRPQRKIQRQKSTKTKRIFQHNRSSCSTCPGTARNSILRNV